MARSNVFNPLLMERKHWKPWSFSIISLFSKVLKHFIKFALFRKVLAVTINTISLFNIRCEKILKNPILVTYNFGHEYDTEKLYN